MMGIDEFFAFRAGPSRKINKLSKINRSNSLLAFSRIVKVSKFAQWPVCLMCSLMAKGDGDRKTCSKRMIMSPVAFMFAWLV